MLDVSIPYMDNFLAVPTEALRDRFKHQRLFAVPAPIVRDALKQPVTKLLMVTDAGFSPQAARHARTRVDGAAEHVLLLCTAGTGSVTLQGTRYSVAKGDAIMLPAGQSHSYRASANDPWTLWWFHCVGRDADHFVEALQTQLGGPIAHLREPSRIATQCGDIIEALDHSTNAGIMRSSGIAWNVLSAILANGKRALGGSENPIDVALKYLQEATPERIPVDRLAAKVGLSSSQFSALFKAQVGVPPLRYQSDLRMARARELLLVSDLSVTEISEVCGYDDPLYFSRVFARTHGQSPTSYRSQPK